MPIPFAVKRMKSDRSEAGLGVTSLLATTIADLKFSDLPQEAIAVCREILLDGLANMLAGSREPVAEIVAPYIASLGGPENATVIGRGFKTHPVHAAFVNGTFCHALDYEMVARPPNHPTGTTLPALLAVAEWLGLPGKDVVLALAVGFEVQAKLRRATVSASGNVNTEGIHPPGMVGPFGAAAATAKLLGLDEAGIRRALGIAGSRISGISANSGTMVKSTHSGHAARNGVESALLAKAGLTASDSIFEGYRGVNDVYFSHKMDLALVVEGFGEPFQMVKPGLTVKRFPAQYLTHWCICAALELRERHGLTGDQIERVVVTSGPNNPALHKTNPPTGLAGKFSLQYTVAVSLLDGDVRFGAFRDARRFAPDMVALLPRIEMRADPSIDAMDFAHAWGEVTVWTKSGQQHTARVDRPLGIWDNPLGWEERVEKFRDCASAVMKPAEVARLGDLVLQFETLPSIRPLMSLCG